MNYRIPEALSQGHSQIRVDRLNSLVNLNDCWRQYSGTIKQRPQAWLRLEKTQQLLRNIARARNVEFLESNLVTEIPGVLELRQDSNTVNVWVIPELVISYGDFIGEDCYQWALVNFADNLELARIRQSITSEKRSRQQRKVWTRRGVVAASWAIPVVTALALNQKAQAQVSPGPNNNNGGNSSDDDCPEDEERCEARDNL